MFAWAEFYAAQFFSPAQSPQWISVSERLPKERYEVIFSCKYYDQPSVELGFLCEDANWQLVRTDSQDMPIIIPRECVTHWQPLPAHPAAPKKEKQ